MTIRLSEHLKLRVKVRKIDELLPKKIVGHPENIYFDKETNHFIAVKKGKYADKVRPMIAVFDKVNSNIEIITVYPSDDKEISARVVRKRWIYVRSKN